MAAMDAPTLRFSQINADKKKFAGFLDLPFPTSSSEKTVLDLENEIASQTGQCVSYIAYRGVRLEKHRQISTLIPDLHNDSNFRFSVHTTSGENIFFVKSLSGNSVVVDLPFTTTTVKELKEEVEVLERIPAEYQRFLYNGKHFADGKTLHDYGVERDSTVHLLARLRGGAPPAKMIEFSDLQNESALKVLPWSKTAPVWRLVGKGLNLEGKCTNKACAANGHQVVCKKGFTVVNLVEEKACCPVCKEVIQVKTCSFTSCSWMYEGRKVAPKPKKTGRMPGFLANCFGKSNTKTNADDEEYPAVEKVKETLDIVSPWFKASNKYEYFKQTQNMVQWQSLLVVAKKIPTVSKNESNADVQVEDACSICFHNFDDGKTHTTNCGHTFHAECVETWLACNGTACPICRVELVIEQ